ncbi:MAG: GIY-YIG nuclease family protein [Gammaproteobacteria bacterium]
MAFWVYILRCADGSYYTGHTDNLEKRIGEHETSAGGGYTKERLPVALVWSQECAAREEALAAERLEPEEKRSDDARGLERSTRNCLGYKESAARSLEVGHGNWRFSAARASIPQHERRKYRGR